MSENIHDDEFFRKVYNHFEEEPSPGVWDKLNARLDQKDAAVYHAKYASWKRIAVVLLFLLGSAAAYEIFFRPDNRSSVPSAKEKQLPATDSSALQQPSSNQVEPPNSITSSLDEANTNTPFAPKQNNNQDTQRLTKNAAGKASHTKVEDQHIIANHTNTINEIAEKGDIETKQNKAFVTHRNTIAKAEQDNKKEIESQLLKAENSIADTKEDKENKTALLNERNTYNSDSAIINQHTDSALVINKSLDSSANSITAGSKKSPIKIKNFYKPQLSFSPYIAADFAGHQIDNDKHHRDPDRQDERHEIEERENNQSSFSAGLIVRYQFSKNISFKSGLVYSNTAIHINPETLYAARDNDQSISYKYVSSMGYAYVKPSFDRSPVIGDSILSDNTEQHVSYLSLPLMAGYNINAGKKLTLIPGIGFTMNILVGSKMETEVKRNNEQSNVTIKKLQGLAPVYFSFATDIELHCQLSNNFSLMLLPSFKYAFIPVTANHVVRTYPYNLGVGVGVTYKL